MRKESKRITSVLLLIPFFSVLTFCCCLERHADASDKNASMKHHQKLEKPSHHCERHHSSNNDDKCCCPKHLGFLSEQPFEITPDLSLVQFLAKNFLTFPQFEVVLLSSSSLHAQGPPWQDHRDQVSIPIFLKNSNLRI